MSQADQWAVAWKATSPQRSEITNLCSRHKNPSQSKTTAAVFKAVYVKWALGQYRHETRICYSMGQKMLQSKRAKWWGPLNVKTVEIIWIIALIGNYIDHWWYIRKHFKAPHTWNARYKRVSVVGIPNLFKRKTWLHLVQKKSFLFLPSKDSTRIFPQKSIAPNIQLFSNISFIESLAPWMIDSDLAVSSIELVDGSGLYINLKKALLYSCQGKPCL